MSNFWQRLFTGAVFVSAIIASILVSPYLFIVLFLVINILSIIEFYRLFQKNNHNPRKITGVFFSVLLYSTSVMVMAGVWPQKILLLSLPFVFLLFVLELFLISSKPFENIAYTLLGIFYITVPLILFNAMALMQNDGEKYHWQILMGYFLILWASDTGAYLTGRQFGKHKLFERISPKKTWEGSVGGLLSAFLLGYICSVYYTDFTLVQWQTIALIIVVTGTFGDLIESMLKRSLNIKDSGSILPGHGGLLDRLDGLFISVPFVFFYLVLIGKI